MKRRPKHQIRLNQVTDSEVSHDMTSSVEMKPCSACDLPDLVELWGEYMVDQGEDPLIRFIDLEASREGVRRVLEGCMKREPLSLHVAVRGGEVVGFSVSFKDALRPNYVLKAGVGRI